MLPGLHWPEAKEIEFDLSGITGMDTAGAWLLFRTASRLEQQGKIVSLKGLPADAQTLLQLVVQAGVTTATVRKPVEPGVLESIGRNTVERLRQNVSFLAFIGEMAAVTLQLLKRPRRIRWRATLHELAEAGYKALVIVGLLSFLLGIVIAYQGGVQLREYGAGIFIADLVGLSMLRELAPLMTAIIVAGRTGSAYTAQIGTMKITEEVDALRSMGIAPMELLVLPKLFALVVALPLLTVYADISGVIGGMVMANTMLGVGPHAFLERLTEAITLDSYLIGVGKAPVFAAIIGSVGCHRGFQVGGSAESVGRQTTVSVVESIFLVIVVDAAFSIVFSWLGI
jgi:phospholipid/cholesterol/gamma-HCH transport system permease protein